MSQDSYAAMDPRMRIDQILAEPMSIQKTGNARQIAERIMEIIEQVGLTEEILDRYPHEFSGGQLQRAGICRALMNQPRIIFADEPTGALNSQAGRQAMELMQHFHQQGASILLVTHDASVATYADKVLLILDGKIKKEVLFDQTANQDERRQLLLADLNQIGI